MQVMPLNRYALRRYEEFVQALEAVGEAFSAAADLIKKYDSKATTSWAVPEKEELVAAKAKAVRALGALRKSAAQYEGDLISRAWRV